MPSPLEDGKCQLTDFYQGFCKYAESWSEQSSDRVSEARRDATAAAKRRSLLPTKSKSNTVSAVRLGKLLQL